MCSGFATDMCAGESDLLNRRGDDLGDVTNDAVDTLRSK
jgi:hypothetical protein